MSRKHAIRCLMFAGVAGIALAANWDHVRAEEPVPPIKPDNVELWDAGTGFTGFKTKPNKTPKSVSGIACVLNKEQQRMCLVVFDEGLEARYAILGTGAYEIDNEQVILLAGEGELDGEGAATDGKSYYVVGSHSAKRDDCASNLASRHVIRINVDPETGKVQRDESKDLVGYEATGSLWSVMGKLDSLKDYVGEEKCLGTEPPKEAPSKVGQRGVNIEGVAIKEGRLYFGFRGPAFEDETTRILGVGAEDLFQVESPKAVVTKIKVGKGRGIRDLQAVKDGILLLLGPDDDKANKFKDYSIALWNALADEGDIAKPKELARLDLSDVKLRDCDKEMKPEAMAVTEDEKAYYHIVILSDGLCDGGPLSFKIPRQPG